MKQPASEPQPIVVECDLPQAPETVWRALTERELLGAWLLPNDLCPEVGAKFNFTSEDGRRQERIDCEVLQVEPNRTLRWRQTEDVGGDASGYEVSSVVTIELTSNTDGGTHLRLEHGDFAVASAADSFVAATGVAGANVIAFRRWPQPPHGAIGKSRASNFRLRAPLVSFLKAA